MPIKGWCDVPRVPRVGKIHLGIRTRNDKGKEYPKAVDYFVVKPDESTSEAAAAAFHSVYGDKPQEITVAFPTNDPEQFFPQYLAAYQGGGGKYKLFCKGDGETASRADGQGNRVQIPCLYKDCPIYQQGKCKEIGRLQFFLPDVPGIGVWQIDTSSYHTTANLNGSIQMIRALTGGRIAMIPLTLRIVPKVVNPDGIAKTVYVLELAVQDMKLTDFLRQTPLLTTGTPLVEPIPQDELPEDLYIDANIVPDTGVDVDADPSEPAQADVGDITNTGDVAAVADVKFRRNQSNREVSLVQLATQDGELIKAMTDEPRLIEQLKRIKAGTAVKFRTTPSDRWQIGVELVDLAIVS
ncbi:MAG: hypothetical protein K6T81_19195 [Alicyclobacillus macrosporangiidus]|uniref:recombination directionality factor n=1 Tax=Alicyclobacillus macrosporangiidus TaxID=392015 RepID=UPI0026E92A49|nr:hypothetical protein [Alicyclobacillus macrosporangiidus]MCL6600837.1 hypothetical protein [Alicyclobacillus macrosporangiidus]